MFVVAVLVVMVVAAIWLLRKKPDAVYQGGVGMVPTEKPPTFWRWLLLAAGTLAIGVVALGYFDTDSPKAKGRRAISYCWEQYERKSLDLAEKRFIAGACEQLENDFRQKFGVKP